MPLQPVPARDACRRGGIGAAVANALFGYHGKPFFVQGPNDDSIAVMEVLERSVGSERFDFVATEP